MDIVMAVIVVVTAAAADTAACSLQVFLMCF